MYAFSKGVSCGISYCGGNGSDAVTFQHLDEFAGEFWAVVEDAFQGPGVSTKPVFVELEGNVGGRFLCEGAEFDPVCAAVDDGEDVDFEITHGLCEWVRVTNDPWAAAIGVDAFPGFVVVKGPGVGDFTIFFLLVSLKRWQSGHCLM